MSLANTVPGRGSDAAADAPIACAMNSLRSIREGMSICFRGLATEEVSLSKLSLQVLKALEHRAARIVRLHLVLYVSRIRKFDLLCFSQNLHYRRSSLSEALVRVLGIAIAILQVQAYNAAVVLPEVAHRIKSGGVEVADVEIDAEVRRSPLQGIREILRRLELLRSVASIPLFSKPVVVQAELHLILPAPLVQPRNKRLSDGRGHHLRPKQQCAIEPSIQVFVVRGNREVDAISAYSNSSVIESAPGLLEIGFCSLHGVQMAVPHLDVRDTGGSHRLDHFFQAELAKRVALNSDFDAADDGRLQLFS